MALDHPIKNADKIQIIKLSLRQTSFIARIVVEQNKSVDKCQETFKKRWDSHLPWCCLIVLTVSTTSHTELISYFWKLGVPVFYISSRSLILGIESIDPVTNFRMVMTITSYKVLKAMGFLVVGL